MCHVLLMMPLLGLGYLLLRQARATRLPSRLMMVVSLVVLTLTMLFFRGAGIQLYWPWAMPAGH